MSIPMKLERTVTLGLIATVLLQTAGALVWVGAAESRIAGLEHEMNVRWGVSQRLARLEGETAIVREQLQRIEAHLLDYRGYRSDDHEN
ncbi:MAG: hypothetical protein AAFP97_12345 [Pseudomonadota bacterium]